MGVQSTGERTFVLPGCERHGLFFGSDSQREPPHFGVGGGYGIEDGRIVSGSELAGVLRQGKGFDGIANRGIRAPWNIYSYENQDIFCRSGGS